ncbi:hypothetical protein [Frankia sp. AgW1.1]|uniref:hypothetical protein n=1 Tax=Frankia sp. AgW1.1 TaxID=1836971 RepID=UPI001931B24F|nr:hypothetical protein [Frankia sp. AgW1.1]MBL7487135.1 hypothetical protein [Frankia sp. AgW1.1]
MTATMWTLPETSGEEAKPLPAIWNLDRVLCDMAATKVREVVPATASLLDAYVNGPWGWTPPGLWADTKLAWLAVWRVWPEVDPSLPAEIADLLAEYRQHAPDPRPFLRQVWAAERRLRGDSRVHGTPESPTGWRILADILPALWI